jgi:protein phosphatase methylesterase 1
VNPPGNDTTFRVYLNPTEATKESKHGTYLICHHGGGSSALSFAALAKEVKVKSNGELGLLAYDCRGHGTCHGRVSSRLTCTGKTRTEGPHSKATDLSLATLLSDMMGVITHIFPDPKESPSFVVRHFCRESD